jgi:hypothetical protein
MGSVRRYKTLATMYTKNTTGKKKSADSVMAPSIIMRPMKAKGKKGFTKSEYAPRRRLDSK